MSSHHHHHEPIIPDNRPFALYLKENTRASHDSVDHLVMSVQPFANRENYIGFLHLQSVFHKIVDDIYKDPKLNEKIPDLASLARYDTVLLDLADLGSQAKTWATALPKPTGAEALGWLYCAEGSNVGAAFLYKDAQNHLDMNAEFGARHLAPHADGRGKHWREFVEYLNQLELSPLDREEALMGALNAFAFYKVLLREIFAIPASI